jgi:hypothetical protein
VVGRSQGDRRQIRARLARTTRTKSGFPPEQKVKGSNPSGAQACPPVTLLVASKPARAAELACPRCGPTSTPSRTPGGVKVSTNRAKVTGAGTETVGIRSAPPAELFQQLDWPAGIDAAHAP